jgi:hypothetical protein
MEKFQVISGGLNLRSAPEGTIIAVLSKGHIVTKIEEAEDNKWWKVQTAISGETLEGYVAARFISPTITSVETLLEVGGISVRRSSSESAFFYQAGIINFSGA